MRREKLIEDDLYKHLGGLQGNIHGKGVAAGNVGGSLEGVQSILGGEEAGFKELVPY